MSIVIRPNVTTLKVSPASTGLVKVRAQGPQGPPGSGAGSIAFVDLTDTPATISAGQYVTGNSAGDALEFVDTIPVADIDGLADVAISGSFDDLVDVPATFTPSAHTHDAADVVSGQFANARISEGSVTQHQSALSITAGQVTGLGAVAYSNDYNDLSNLPTLTGTASDNEILYSDNGSVDGVPGFTWDGTNLDLPAITRIVDGASGSESFQIRSTIDAVRGISFFTSSGNPCISMGIYQGETQNARIKFTGTGGVNWSLGGEGAGEVFALGNILSITGGLGIIISNQSSEDSFVLEQLLGGPFIFRAGVNSANSLNTQIQLRRGQVGGSAGTVTVQTSSSASSYTLTLPDDDGSANQALITDGSGILDWLTLAAIATSGSASDLTSGTVPDARISQGSVTQHQSALLIEGDQVSNDFINTGPVSFVNGFWYDQNGDATASTTTGFGVAGDISMSPACFQRDLTVDMAGIVVTASGTGAARVFVYSSDADGWPDELLLEVDLTLSGTGGVSAATSFTFNKGVIYWVGVQIQNTPTLRAYSINGCRTLGLDAGDSISYLTRILRNVSYASGLPDPWVFNSSEVTNGNPPSVRFRANN